MTNYQENLPNSDAAAALKAYISESPDREMNIFYIAAICDENKAEIVEELSGYDRDALAAEVEKKYPGIEIENE
jgi:hypothetical protein